MARMLAFSGSWDFGCCNMCARKASKPLKPSRRQRHQARAREKRAWRRADTVSP